MQSVEKLELIEGLMWREFQNEKAPLKKVGILSSIVNMQTTLSAYYDATMAVIDNKPKFDNIKRRVIAITEKEASVTD